LPAAVAARREPCGNKTLFSNAFQGDRPGFGPKAQNPPATSLWSSRELRRRDAIRASLTSAAELTRSPPP
jgi:hypothetical protein